MALGGLAILGFTVMTGITIVIMTVLEQTVDQDADCVEFLVLGVVLAAGIAAFSDMCVLGCKVVEHQSPLAASLGWMIALPLGLLLTYVMHNDAATGFFFLIVVSFTSTILAFQAKGFVLTIVSIGGLGYLLSVVHENFNMNSLDDHDVMIYLPFGVLGAVLVFFSIYWPARQALTLRWVEDWEHVEKLDPNDPSDANICRNVMQFFDDSCALRANMYEHLTLNMVNIYKVGESHNRQIPRNHNYATLFHGTSWAGARGIIYDGFRLPTHAGMFGKGIYFADSPLKSWRYANQEQAIPPPICCSCCGCCMRGGLIFICTIDLGEVRPESAANHGLGEQSCWECMTCQKSKFDSVIGLSKEHGGELRVPEYVIYDPSQARIDFIIEVKAHDDGSQTGYLPAAQGDGRYGRYEDNNNAYPGYA